MAEHEPTRRAGDTPSGELTALSCPDCDGNIWRVREGHVAHYACRVGHAYSPENMRAAAEEAVERALWTALRVLEENAALHQELAAQALQQNETRAADELQSIARLRLETAETLRRMLSKPDDEFA